MPTPTEVQVFLVEYGVWLLAGVVAVSLAVMGALARFAWRAAQRGGRGTTTAARVGEISVLRAVVELVSRALWLLSAFGAAAAVLLALSLPAVQVSFAAVVAIAPYVFARSWDEITRRMPTERA